MTWGSPVLAETKILNIKLNITHTEILNVTQAEIKTWEIPPSNRIITLECSNACHPCSMST
jgi:hypothetical protein